MQNQSMRERCCLTASLPATPPLQVEAAFPCRRTRLVVGCKAGLRSTPACALLAQAGYRRLRNMPAGFDGWVAAGLPVDSGPLQPGGAAAGWLSWE